MSVKNIQSYALSLVISGLLLTACAKDVSQQEIGRATEGYIVTDVNKVFVVDCVLPGQVRRLGSQMTYLTQRRPVKTSAADCEVRGGEYVAYDRANYATALNIWLSKAQEGDAIAQLYVGEIYEKGLGIPANYQTAAQWYEKAANQGNYQAQINLGHLYEKGQGVPQNKEIALSWYRKSVDLDQAGIPFTPAVNAEEIETLRFELAESRQQAESIRAEMGDLQQQTVQQQQRLRQAQTELKALRKQLNRPKSAAAASGTNSEAIKLQLHEKEAQVKKQQAKLDALSQSLDQERQQNRNLDRLVVKSTQEKQQLRSQIEQISQQAATQQESLRKAQRELDVLRQELQQKKSQPNQSGDVNKLERQLRDKESQIREQQAKMDQLELSLSQERQKMKQSLENQSVKSSLESNNLRAELDDARQQANELKNNLSLAQKEQKSLVKQLQQQKTNLETVDVLESKLLEKESQIKAQQAKMDELNLALHQEREQIKQAFDSKTRSSHETEKMRTQLDELQAQAANQQQRLQVAQTELETLRHQLQQQQSNTETHEALEKKLREKDAQIKQLQTQLDAQQASVPAQPQANPLVVSGNGPNIEILQPTVTITRGIPVIQFMAGEHNKRLIGRVDTRTGVSRVTVNDSPITVKNDGYFETELNLNGEESLLHISATDKRNQSSRLDLRLLSSVGVAPNVLAKDISDEIRRPIDIQFGKFYALIIGNSAYNAYPPLTTPIADAKSVEALLREQYGFQTKLLINANRYTIMSAFNELNQKLNDQDNLLIYYAGHGEVDKKSRTAYWLPVDAEVGNSANWISSQSINELLSIMPAKHILVVADSCYSGALTGSAVAKLPDGMDETKRERWLKAMNKRKARTVLTSGGVKPVMDQGGGSHSVFANAFLKTLRSNKRIIEDYDIFRDVADQVRVSASHGGFEQNPQYAPLQHAGHEGSPFFFVPES